jgi:plasmid stabilization system protein ParE
MEIADYISEFSTDAALRQISRIEKAIYSLENFPYRGKKAGLVDGMDLHQINIDRYKILYLIFDEHVEIYRIVHMKRNVKF